jgi:hypothetical protein
MVLGVVVGGLQDTLVEAGVINRGMSSDGLANLWARSDFKLQCASVDLLVVSPNFGLHGSQ